MVVSKVNVPEPESFTTLVQPYLGKKLTKGKLNALIADVISYYRRHDHPIVDVIVPQQDITNGVVQLVILEGHVGSVTVAGNRWFSSESIALGVRLQPGDTISPRQLQSDLDWLNRIPSTRPTWSPPRQSLGETDSCCNPGPFSRALLHRLRRQRQCRDRLRPLRGRR